MSAFVSTNTEIALIDARTRNGTILLPAVSSLLNRVLTFKDMFGAVGLSTVILQTQGLDVFEDGTTIRRFTSPFQSLTVYGATNLRWATTGGTTWTTQNVSSLSVSSFSFGTGGGWVTAGALQAVVISTIQQNTAVSYISSLYVGSTTSQVPGYTLWANGPSRIQQLIIGQTSTITGGAMQQIASAAWDLQMMRANAAANFGSASWVSYSDQRVKENITDANLDRCYHDIKNVKLRRFMFISSLYEETQSTDRHVLGFVAQEVSTIIPKTVIVAEGCGYSNFNYFNIDQLNMSLYGAVKKTIYDKEILESTVKGQRFELETLYGKTSMIMSTLEGLQGR